MLAHLSNNILQMSMHDCMFDWYWFHHKISFAPCAANLAEMLFLFDGITKKLFALLAAFRSSQEVFAFDTSFAPGLSQ